jgi:hypothetical protein
MAVKGPDGQVLMDHASTICNPTSPDCGSMTGAFNTLVYQPGSRYWLFQGIETGLYLALAGLLIWLALRRMGRIA